MEEAIITYKEIIKKLKELKEVGFIKTHRGGNTGVGKTLEDILGIKENNIPGPNAKMIELKSTRKGASSMVTLLTLAPLPRSSNSRILKRYGYLSSRGNNRKVLHTTVNSLDFNTIKGEHGFKIEIQKNKVDLINAQKEVLCYWDRDTLKNAFERKFPRLLYVKADSRGRGSEEEFWYKEAWLLSGFDFKNFIRLLKKGTILVDIRIGQYRDGRTHDHGTGFRVFPDKLDLCFSDRKRIM